MKEEFIRLLKEVKREGMDALLLFLEGSDFYKAPASTKYHGAWEGGLLEHSLKVYEVLKSNLNDSTKYELIKSWDKVLSLDLTTLESNNIDIDEEYIQKQIDLRNKAKQEKNYQLADQIRNDLAAKGIILKDTREATIYEINTNISHN